jgi:hypothetical protein
VIFRDFTGYFTQKSFGAISPTKLPDISRFFTISHSSFHTPRLKRPLPDNELPHLSLFSLFSLELNPTVLTLPAPPNLINIYKRPRRTPE